MPNNPLLPASLQAEIAELERRIRALETSNQLLSSAITAGTLTINTATGAQVATIGDIPGSDYGLRVNTTNNPNLAHLEVAGDNGVVLPLIAHPWRPGDFSPKIVTSSTFVQCWTCEPLIYSGKYIEFKVAINQNAGTSCEVQLRHLFPETILGGTLALSNATNSLRFRAAHAGAMRTSEGNPLILEVRRTAGTGNVSVSMPTELNVGGVVTGGVANGWTIEFTA